MLTQRTIFVHGSGFAKVVKQMPICIALSDLACKLCVKGRCVDICHCHCLSECYTSRSNSCPFPEASFIWSWSLNGCRPNSSTSLLFLTRLFPLSRNFMKKSQRRNPRYSRIPRLPSRRCSPCRNVYDVDVSCCVGGCVESST